ncbi:MAG: mechanosensitive ion channel family protein [Chloroflexota bacterium]|nr:mechanosensitive ion channel family protein [Chloroflexota bacterium]
MVAWFTENAIWILIISVLVLFIMLFATHQVGDIVRQAKPQKWLQSLHKGMRRAAWVVEGLSLVALAMALSAIITTREGIPIVTPGAVQTWLLQHGVLILIIILVAYLLHRVSRLAIPEVVERSVKVRGEGRRAQEELAKRSHTLGGILSQTVSILILVVAVFMVLSELNVPIAPLLAGAGVVGVAIGFGAQSLVRDLMNGIFILMEDQYNQGDVVRIAGISGLVEEVNLRRTVLRDLDGIVHTIPNGQVTTASNFTKDWSRVNLNIPVAYDENLDRVIKVINGVGKELTTDTTFGPMIISTPKVLRVDNFGELGMEIKILGDTKPLKQWDVMGELRKRIKEAFDKEGIKMWPHAKFSLFQRQDKDKDSV